MVISLRLLLLAAVLFVSYRTGAPAQAAEFHSVQAIDVELSENQSLAGQLLDSAGQPIPAKSLRLLNARGDELDSITDAGGKFQFSTLRGGLYGVAFGHQVTPVRLWSHGTVPPHAIHHLLVSAGRQVRGQCRLGTQSWAHGNHPNPAIPGCDSGECGPHCGKHCGRGLLRQLLFRKCRRGCDPCDPCGCGHCRVRLFPHLGFAAVATAIVYASIDEDNAS